MSELLSKAQKLKSAAKKLGMLSTVDKNEALALMADRIISEKEWGLLNICYRL